MALLITGANGFLGSLLCKTLKKKGFKIIAVVNENTDKIKELQSSNFKIIKGGVHALDFEYLVAEKIKGIFHLASKQPSPNLEQLKHYLPHNLYTTEYLIGLIEESGIVLDFFIYTSSISVFGKPIIGEISNSTTPSPINSYGMSKYFSEILIESKTTKINTKFIILRLQSIFGKNDGYGLINYITNELSNNKDVVLYSRGEIKRNFIHIEDVVLVLLSILENYNSFKRIEVFPVASPRSLTTKEIAELIQQELNSNGKIIMSDEKFIYDWDIIVNSEYTRNKVPHRVKPLEESIKQYIKEYDT